jgi:hypothetical protein
MERGWIHEISEIKIEPLNRIASLYGALSGVISAKLFALLEKYGSPNYALVDEVFYRSSFFENTDKTLAISYKTAKLTSELYLVDVALFIQLWAARTLQSCNESSCLISDIEPLSSRQVICNECQHILPSKLTTSLLSLISLKDMQQQMAHCYINEKIGMFLRENNINVDAAGARVASATFITNYVIDTNDNLRGWLKECGNYVSSSKERFKHKYSALSKPMPKLPAFIVSRRWNSWTPNIPGNIKNFGGGYLVSDGTSKVAIDPGYGYLEMLSTHGLTIMDVDAIIITHDHPDHIAELQNMLGLRYEFKEIPNKLNLYLNGSTYYLYQRLASYYTPIINDNPVRIKAGDVISVGDLTINTCKMYHNEIYNYLPTSLKKKVGNSASLGLSISGSYDGNIFNFAILGDTSFPNDSVEQGKLSDFFGKPDIAAVHLGSIEPQWNSDNKASDIHYGDGKHLGLNGVIKAIHLLQPKVTVITEFGEEHDRHDDRLSIVAIIKEACKTATTAVIPSDIHLRLVMSKYGILAKCTGHECHGFVHTKNIELSLSDDKSISYSFPSGCKSGLSHYQSNLFGEFTSITNTDCGNPPSG